MTREEKYDLVNKCEDFESLAKAIESLASTDGMIQGRTTVFNAKTMADACRNFHSLPPNFFN